MVRRYLRLLTTPLIIAIVVLGVAIIAAIFAPHVVPDQWKGEASRVVLFMGGFVALVAGTLSIIKDLLDIFRGEQTAVDRMDEQRSEHHGGGPLVQFFSAPSHEQRVERLSREMARTRGVSIILGEAAILTSLAPAPNNVPWATRFVGRTEELITLSDQLRKAEMRGVVVTGIGGIGKSALVAQAAHRNAQHFPGGMVWISARGHDRFGLADVLDAIDHVMGLKLGKYGETRREHMALEALRTRPVLLILDDMETLEEEAKRQVSAFVNQLDIRAGSKVVLSLRYHDQAGFRELDAMCPLDLLGLDTESAVQHILSEAEEKGVETLLQASEADLRTLADRVDGHPLMLELIVGLRDHVPIRKAASELPAELKDRVQALLSTSVAATGEEGTRLLPRLVVFPGSWDHEAMRVVCGTPGLDVSEGRKQLLESSLLRLEQDRYSLHQLVRDNVLTKMALETEVEEELRLKHASHYLDVAEQADAKLGAEDTGAAVRVLDEELDNIRAGMDWSRTRGGKDGWQLIVRYSCALTRFFSVRGMWQEWSDWGEAALTACHHFGDIHATARAYSNLGVVHTHKNDWARAIELYEIVLEIMRRTGNLRGIAQTYTNMGTVYQRKGDKLRSIELYGKALAILEQLRDTAGMATVYMNLGIAHGSAGNWDRAIDMQERSLEINTRLGHTRGLAQSYMNLGLVYSDRGDWDLAIDLFEKAQEIFERLGDSHGTGATYNNLGLVYARKGDKQRAHTLYDEALTIMKRLRDRDGIASTWTNMGILLAERGDRGEAGKLWRKALDVFEELGSAEQQRVRALLEGVDVT